MSGSRCSVVIDAGDGALLNGGIAVTHTPHAGWMYRAGSSVVMVGCSPHTGQSGSRSGNGTARHVIASASNVAQVEGLVRATQLQLSADDVEALDAASAPEAA